MRRNLTLLSILVGALLAPLAGLRADGNWSVRAYRAKPGYQLETGNPQTAIDLIAAVPWLNPLTGQMETPVEESSTSGHAVINFTDPDAPGAAAAFPNPEPFPLGRPGVDDDHFAILATGTLRVQTSGFYSFIAGHDDTFALSVDGQTADWNGRQASGGCCNAARPVFTFSLPAGDLPIELRYGESTGTASLQLIAAAGADVEYIEDGPYRLVGDATNGGLEIVSSPPCLDPPEIARIAGVPEGTVEAGSVVELDGSGSSAGGSGTLSFAWSIVSGPGAMAGLANGPKVKVRGVGEGVVVVQLTVDDGVCANPGTANAFLQFQAERPSDWTVTMFRAARGYLLQPDDHQPALDLIDDVPWQNPASGELESPIADELIGYYPMIDFEDPGSPGDGGRFPGTLPFPEDRTEHDEDQFALLCQGTVRIPATGHYSFIVGHDDTFELSVDGSKVDVNGQKATATCCNAEGPVLTFLLTEGEVPITLTYGESYAGAFVEFFAAPGYDVLYEAGGPYRRVGDGYNGGLELVPRTPCDDPPEKAAIAPPPAAPVDVGAVAVLDGNASTAGGPGPVSYRWEVYTGPGEIDGRLDGPTARVRGLAEGEVVVQLTVDDGLCRNAAFARAAVTFRKGSESVNWIRGDSSGDRLLDITDAIVSLQILFGGGAPAPCPQALDQNEDGKMDISDPIYFLGLLFLGTPLPASWQKCEQFDGCAPNCP